MYIAGGIARTIILGALIAIRPRPTLELRVNTARLLGTPI